MDSQESSPAQPFKSINSSTLCLLYGPALTTLCDHWEDRSLDYTTFVSRVMPLLLNTLPRFVIAFLPRSNHLISWLQSPSAVILEPKKRKSVTTSTFSHAVMGPDAMILAFLIIVLSQLFHCPPSPSSKGSLVRLRFLSLELYHPHICGCWRFSHLSSFQLVTHSGICHDVLSVEVKQTGWQQTALS